MRSVIVAVFCLTLPAAVGCGRQPPPPAGDAAAAPVLVAGESAAAAGKKYDHPSYANWAAFPVGTVVVQETVTENENNPEKTVTTIEYKLVEKSDAELVVEFTAATRHYTGREETNPPQKMRHPRTYTLPDGVELPKRVANATDETITVRAGTFKTARTAGKEFTEGGELRSNTWASDDVPGGLVKSVNRVEAKKATITVELVAVKKP